MSEYRLIENEWDMLAGKFARELVPTPRLSTVKSIRDRFGCSVREAKDAMDRAYEFVVDGLSYGDYKTAPDGPHSVRSHLKNGKEMVLTCRCGCIMKFEIAEVEEEKLVVPIIDFDQSLADFMTDVERLEAYLKNEIALTSKELKELKDMIDAKVRMEATTCCAGMFLVQNPDCLIYCANCGKVKVDR